MRSRMRSLAGVVRSAWGFFFSSRRRHTRLQGDWSSDVCSSDLVADLPEFGPRRRQVLNPEQLISRLEALALGVAARLDAEHETRVADHPERQAVLRR